ncbi:MAG: L-2-amino-thiazoline-4-carboxylic acid hydrolase [Gammaproteobacteria bacterium]|nr:L-2-amino-thiazoline-4-carboxylic acid hydrolase [Gammaproteobacteria bacterium]
MSNKAHRREFFKISLATGCLATILRPSLAADTAIALSSCEEEIKQAVQDAKNKERNDKISLLSKIRNKCGDDVVKVTRQYTADKVQKKYTDKEIEKRDLSAVKSQLWERLSNDKYAFEKVKDTDEYLEYKVTRCHLAESVKELNEPELAYASICAWDEGFCRGINPNIKFTRTKTLINGDDCCNHTYELKRTDIKKL